MRGKRAAEEADRESSSETNPLYRLALTKKAQGDIIVRLKTSVHGYTYNHREIHIMRKKMRNDCIRQAVIVEVKWLIGATCLLWGGQCGVCGPGGHIGHLENCILII